MCMAMGGGGGASGRIPSGSKNQGAYYTSWQPAGTNQWGGQSYVPVNYPTRGPRSQPGWTSNSAGGYDLAREQDLGRTLSSLTVPNIGGTGANIIGSGWRNREYMRGYNPFGQWIGQPKGMGTSSQTSQPATAPETTTPPPPPINPFEGLNINIPDPPPPPKAYQRQTSPASKKQRRAKTRKSSAEGKAGLTIERINY